MIVMYRKHALSCGTCASDLELCATAERRYWLCTYEQCESEWDELCVDTTTGIPKLELTLGPALTARRDFEARLESHGSIKKALLPEAPFSPCVAFK